MSVFWFGKKKNKYLIIKFKRVGEWVSCNLEFETCDFSFTLCVFVCVNKLVVVNKANKSLLLSKR